MRRTAKRAATLSASARARPRPATEGGGRATARPAVAAQRLLACIAPALQLGGGDVRRLAAVLAQFAERLAPHVDAGEQLVAGSGPAARATRHDGEIAIAHQRQLRGGAVGEA